MRRHKHIVEIELTFDKPVEPSYARKAAQEVFHCADKDVILGTWPNEIVRADVRR